MLCLMSEMLINNKSLPSNRHQSSPPLSTKFNNFKNEIYIYNSSDCAILYNNQNSLNLINQHFYNNLLNYKCQSNKNLFMKRYYWNYLKKYFMIGLYQTFFIFFYYRWFLFCNFVSGLENIPLGQRVLPSGMEQPRQRIQNVLGGIYSQNVTLFFRNSPYRVQSELIVQSSATLTIETGVQMYFDTGVGMKIFGTIKAIGNEFAHIQFLPYQEQFNYDHKFPEFRLIDGPSVRQGRLQIRFRDRWRSVCNKLTNWTSIDTGVACRSMGYSDGSFWRYFRRNNDTYPFVIPKPNCLLNTKNLWNCEGFADLNAIPLTENLCQGEDDLGLYCWGPPTFSGWAKHWKGLQIYNSPFSYVYSDPNFVSTQRESLSRLEFIDILYAGYDGLTKNATASLYIEGVPPIINGIRIEHSARDGIYFYKSHGPILIANSTIKHNRGHGIIIDNTIDGRFFLNQSIVNENYGDGIWYRQQHPQMTQSQQFYGYKIGGTQRQKRHNFFYENERPRIDMCVNHEIKKDLFFPHLINGHLQNGTAIDLSRSLSYCWMMIALPPQLRYSYTIQFINVKNRNPSLFNSNTNLLICDGNSSFPNYCQMELYRIPLKNGVLPQSVTLPNFEKPLFIGIEHQPGDYSKVGTVYGDVDVLFKIHASVTYKGFYGLNITNSVILNNTGNGIQAINIRDRTALSNVSVNGNQGLAGFLIRDGAADVWLNDTSFSYNWGDGINISYAGGSINVNSSQIVGNRFRGFAFHYNDSIPFLALRHEIIIKGRPANNIFYPKMRIFDNLWGGILIGNICVPIDFSQPKVLINWVELINNKYHPAIELFTCQHQNSAMTRIDISGNNILYGSGMGLRVEPCVNVHLTIESNRFHSIKNSAILIRNVQHPQLWRLPAMVYIYKNDIKRNTGYQYIVSIGLNEDSPYQNLTFKQQNEVRSNIVINQFPHLKARSTPHAALVVSSSNVQIQHNCFGNPDADYEIGTELMEHAKYIDASKNSWGDVNPQNFMPKIFDQFYRYSLAKIEIVPYAAVCNQHYPTLTNTVTYYRKFQPNPNLSVIGGIIYENSDLPVGTYTVTDDLQISPGAKLTLSPGTRLEFLNGVGMLVQGELLRADYMNPMEPIIFTSVGFNLPKLENVRLVDEMGNEDVIAGRLEVRLNDGLWGTVCNRSWTAQLTQLTCNQLGLIMDPQYFENWRIFPEPGDLPIRMDNIRCEERESDITECRHDGQLHNVASRLSCRPTEVVGIRCALPHWAGVRYSLLANPPTMTGQVTMHNWIIERAGLFDFRTSLFSPALQIDWNSHVFNSLTIRDNFYNGLDILYNDLTKKPSIRHSYFARNRRNGLVIRSNGITIENVIIEGNANAGIHYNSRIDMASQRDIVSWLYERRRGDYKANNVHSIPNNNADYFEDNNTPEVIEVFESQHNQRIFLIPNASKKCLKARNSPCVYNLILKASGNQFGLISKLAIQIINRCHNESDEDAIFFDPHAGVTSLYIDGKQHRNEWSARHNLIEFPIVSKGSTLQMRYTRSYGQPKLVLLVLFLDAQEYLDRFMHVYESIIRQNQYAISAVYYNNLTFADNGAVLGRFSEEKLWFQKVNFSQNVNAVLWIQNLQHEIIPGTPIAQIGWHIDNCSFVNNYGPIVNMHRDFYASANVFNWNFWSNTFSNNTNFGARIQLPDTYDLLALQEHKFIMTENRFEKNQNFAIQLKGYYAFVNISSNNFTDNSSMDGFGILELSGMERHLIMERNRFFNNWGAWMVRIETLSQSLRSFNGAEIPAFIQYNYFQFNHFIGKIDDYIDMWPRSYALGVFGTQKIDIHFNRFRNVLMDFELVAGCNPQFPGIESMNVTHNWWGVANEAEVSQRIFDVDDWNIYTVAEFSPYYTSEELFINFWWDLNKAQLFFANYTEPSVLDLKGRMFESKTLTLDAERWYSFPYYYRPFRPYRITRDLTIMPGATLIIERNVEVHIWPNVRILVLGNLIADGTLWQPIRFKPINSTEFAEQNGRVETRYRRFALKRAKVKNNKSFMKLENVQHLFSNDEDEYTSSKFWDQRRGQLQRNANTLLWKRFRWRDKRHNIDTRFVSYRKKLVRNNQKFLKESMLENIDIFRQFPEMKRDNAGLQEFSVMLYKNGSFYGRSGFLSYYNKTTDEIVPSCDRLFTIRNAQVVCRELGFDSQNAYHWLTPRWDYLPHLRILKTYVESRECRGNELQLDKCELRLSGNLSNWQCIDSEHFNYIHCGISQALSNEYVGHWGGITFAPQSLDYVTSAIRNDGGESSAFIKDKSILRHVEIVGGGLSHNDSLQAASLQLIRRAPIIENLNVTNSSMHSVQIISPSDNIALINLNISVSKGIGISITSANLHSSSNANSVTPQGSINLPYSLPGILNMCASGKIIEVKSRVLLFYKYDSVAIDCVKLFKISKSFNAENNKNSAGNENGRTLGFRFLHVNFFDSLAGVGRLDALSIYDGPSFLSSKLLQRFNSKYFRHSNPKQTSGSTVVLPISKNSFESSIMGIHLRATAADGSYGFLAEISILPSAPIAKYVEEVALRNSRLLNNDRGAFSYRNIGEIGPSVIVEQCSIENNGYFIYGNITSSTQSMEFKLHNTILFFFRGNSLRHNHGGLVVLARSSSSVAQLNAVIKNNAFMYNFNTTTIAFVGNNYQKINILNNLVGMNFAPYYDTILVHGVSTNFTENLIFQNVGFHTLDMQSDTNLKLIGDFNPDIFAVRFIEGTGSSTIQTLRRNSFVDNLALGHSYSYTQSFGYQPPDSNDPHDHYDEFHRRPKRQVFTQNGITFDWFSHIGTDTSRYRSTIIVGSASLQKFEKNIFDNPRNNYELTTSQQTQFGTSPIDARENYWGFPSSNGVAAGKIRDQADYPFLTRVNYLPVLESNTSLIEGDCDASYFQVGKEEFKSCFKFVGASMTYSNAVQMCEEMGAFMPILRTDDQRQREIAARVDAIGQKFIVDIEQYNKFGVSYDIPIWISSVMLSSHQCGWISSRTASIGEQNCNNLLPFVCEKGTKPYQEPIMWRNDIVFPVFAFVLVFILLIVFIVLQIYKSQKRKEDFARRKAFVRDSIRRRSKIIENFNSINGKDLALKDSLTNFSGALQPEIVTKTGAFTQKWNDKKLINSETSETIVNSHADNETIYDTCSSPSHRSDFCNAQTYSCCSTESILTPANVKNQITKKEGKNFQKDFPNMRFSRLAVSMNPNPIPNNNLLKTKGKMTNHHRCYNDYLHCGSELYSSFTGSNSIYDSACSGDGSITLNDSLASTQTYSTCCSSTTASTSTTSTLVVDGINKFCKDDSLAFTDDSTIRKQNKSNTRNEWTARNNPTFRASSRLDLSQRSMDVNFLNNSTMTRENINKTNLFSAYSNPSLFFSNQDPQNIPLFNEIDTATSVQTLYESPSSSFRRRQSSGDHLAFSINQCKKKNTVQKSSVENVYENFQSIKSEPNRYKFYTINQDTINKTNPKRFAPFNIDRNSMRDVAKHRPHSAASYIINGEEITPLETSM